ncbi:spore protease YyaC [Clostridium sp.]|uniref:spore protease YyaC n=1 Tax=Clostridium sp. TaxID=1506 RepID=UPI00261BB7E8|nr:spore protease YyaC [Clostridium sp.]
MKSIIYYNSLNAPIRLSKYLKEHLNKNPIIVCIGTDKCIGDCLGPLVGTFLKEKNFNLPVYGTIKHPIHALNLKDKLEEIQITHPRSYVIGIDACLGDLESIGEIHIRDYPIRPGKGVGKMLPSVGDLSIVGIVDSSKNSDIFTNSNIRLNFIFEMAQVISKSLIETFNIIQIENGSN